MDNSQNNVKVSIVMPVFNTAPYLRQCLDSVIAQTLKEFELICVDDGSTDGSLEILKQYAEKDGRIIIRHQENMGPAIARNNALSIAKGKYVAFMDGDDFYPENSTLENLFNAAEQSGCKIAGGYRLVLRNDGSIREEENEKVYKYIKNNLPNGGKVKYTELQTYFNYQCYIYSREFLENEGIIFPDYRHFEDPPFFVKAMVDAGEIYLIPAPTYTYRWGHQNKVWDLRRKNDMLLGHIDTLNLACDYNLGELFANILERFSTNYVQIIFNDISLDSIPLYILCIEMYTIEPPATLTENEVQKQMLTAAENEIMKAFKKFADDDLILFIKKALAECLKKDSEEIYCAAVTSLFRIAGNLKSTTATAMKLDVTENYMNSPYYKPNDDNGTITADDSQLKTAIIWYEQYKKIEKHNAELLSEKAAKPATVQYDVKVSIVMPVYNTAPYLRQCLDSVLAQSLKEFELICVDDGSTDGSIEILEEYAKKDSRIKILKQKNQHAGVARNNGLKVAKGEYVIFLDSDDVFADVLLEHTYSAGVEKKADIVLFDFSRFDHNTKETQRTTISHVAMPDKEIFSWCDIPDDIFSITPPNTFAGIYRRAFINEHKLQFQALPNSNDLYFTFYARALAERITIVDESLVYYRTGRSGSLQSTQKDSNPLCFLQAFYTLYTNLVKDGLFEPLKEGFQSRFFNTLIYNLNSVKTTGARLAILQALDEEPYCNLPIDEKPENFGKNKTLIQYFNEIKAAREWYHKNLRINQLGEDLKNTKTAPPIEEQGTITVSVIIPVYNTKDYLREALDSIVSQTLKDIEIICVNDGSTDGSAGILEEYARKDNRISIITQENKGLSCARNAGIMAAKGKYIYFMDSDDILETTALEELIPIMEEKNLDVLHFDGESFTENPELVTPYFKTAYKRNKAYNDVYEGAELLKLFRQENKYAPVVWLQVYKISLLRENDIYFIPGILHEDNAFTFSVFLNAKRASHTDKIYFHRRLRENSIVNTKTSFINVYSYYKSYQEMVKTYNFAFEKLTCENADYAMNCIASVLNSAQYQYSLLPEEKLGSELGITEDLFSFKRLVVSSANEAKYKEKLNNSWERNNELKEKLQTSWQRNDELKEKLQTSWQRNSELKEKIKNSRQRKNELKEKLDNSKQKNIELKEKLANSQQKKKELKEKLDNSKQKNSEYKKRLEKSKKENKALKKKLKAARDENKRIKNSRAYKIGRIIMYIPKKLRMIFKK